jgi:hypothetical protein
MTSGFRTVIPMDAFDGGLNNKYEPAILEPNESPDCLNVVFDDLGGVQTREGYTVLNTAAVASNPCDGLFTANWNNGNQSMLAWFGTDMFVLSGTTFQTVPSAQGVYATSTAKNTVMYQNLCFIADGNDPPYKYDESVFTRHGIEQASQVTDGGTRGAGGNLAGDYHYALAYVNTQVVAGNISTGSVTIAASGAGESVLLSGIPVPDQSFGVDAKYLYRTIAGSGVSGSYYFVATLPVSATTYSDNIASASLGSEAASDQGKPPAYEFAVVHQERIFCNDSQNPQYLWYSNLENPFVFGALNFIKIADGDGEKITGLAVQGNSVVVFKEASVWLIYMPDTTASNWVRVKSNAKYGCSSHRSIVEYEQQLMYLGEQNGKITGFYAFLGNTTEPDVTALRVTTMFGDAKSDRIEPDVFKFQESNKAKCVGFIFDNKLWFAVTYDTGNTTNNRVYQFDFVRRGKSRKIGSWVPFTGINADAFTVFNDKLYFGSADSDGFVHQLLDGTYTDNGSAINSFYQTKEFDSGELLRHYQKDYRKAEFTVETLGDWLMQVAFILDSDKGGGNTQTIDLNPGGSLWGSMFWGTDDWGGGQDRIDAPITLFGSGKRISFKFSNLNTAGNGFSVVRGNAYFNRRGLRL